MAATRGLAEWVCLALVAEGPTQGWSVARLLAPEAEIGRVWSLSRPLTYRALGQLVADGLVTEKHTEPGAGAARVILSVTPAGRRAVRRWLRSPIPHLRDVRTELLVKLVLSERAGIATEELLHAERETFAPLLETLARERALADADAVDRWRYESSRAVRKFLDTKLGRQ